jgi:hypothetical protein
MYHIGKLCFKYDENIGIENATKQCFLKTLFKKKFKCFPETNVTKHVLPPFIFTYHRLVHFLSSLRQMKRNGGSNTVTLETVIALLVMLQIANHYEPHK